MKKLKDVRALVVDNGLFCHFALKLAEQCAHVDYWTPYVNAFPKSNSTLPGDGLDGIHRVLDFWSAKDKADLIVFVDVMFADMQVECERQGKLVYGARYGETLELDRWGFKKLLTKLNMPVAESHLIQGMTNLRKFLQERSGKWWIKTSRFRGDFETFCSDNYDKVCPKLDEVEFNLGRRALVYPFIVERDIPAILEVGYDGDFVGRFPTDSEACIFGIERKDLGFCGVAKPYGDTPAPLRWVNAKIAPVLREYKYAGLFSSEVRANYADESNTDQPKPWNDSPMMFNVGETVPGEREMYAWFTDPCCRAASPPSELYIEWVGNWPEKIYHGAMGDFVPVEPLGKYGLEAMIHSSWADKNWQPVIFPEEIRKFVKLRNHCKIEGVDSAVPQCYGLPEIGAVISFDDDLPTAIKQLIERADQVDGYYLECKTDAIPKTLKEIAEAQEKGLEFTDEPLPTPDEIDELVPA